MPGYALFQLFLRHVHYRRIAALHDWFILCLNLHDRGCWLWCDELSRLYRKEEEAQRVLQLSVESRMFAKSPKNITFLYRKTANFNFN